MEPERLYHVSNSADTSSVRDSVRLALPLSSDHAGLSAVNGEQKLLYLLHQLK